MNPQAWALLALIFVTLQVGIIWAAYREGHNHGYAAGHEGAQRYKDERDAAWKKLRARLAPPRRPYRPSTPAPRPLPRRQAPRLPIHDLADWPDTVQMPTIVTLQLETVDA